MSVEKGFTKENLDYYLTELFREQEQEEALSKQLVLRVQKYEQKKITENNVEDIIEKALRKKRNDSQ